MSAWCWVLCLVLWLVPAAPGNSTKHPALSTRHEHPALSTKHPALVLFFINGASLTPAVVTAVRAYAVRRLRLVAMRAFTEPHRLERVVRPALGRPRFRVASFWIRHLVLLNQLSAIGFQL
jgi:hypothetical protein